MPAHTSWLQAQGLHPSRCGALLQRALARQALQKAAPPVADEQGGWRRGAVCGLQGTAIQPANLPGAPCSPLLLQRNLTPPLTNSLAQLIKDGIQAAAHARAAKHTLLGGSTGRVHRRSEGRLAPTVHQLNEGAQKAAAA